EEDKLFLDTVKETILRQKPGLEIIQFEFDYISDALKDIRQYNNCYINYLRVGNVIVVPMLSHHEIDRKWEEVYVFTPDDQKALDQLNKWFPECEIFGLTMYDIVSVSPYGWGLNSLTWTIKSHK
ncbi:MAG: hypothetical protein K2K97_04950, partial [Muribaculaceae bacterium]|nr:hypothetical protein [Muribaculaceae bacterium]